MIDQIEKMHLCEVETLYWILEDSLDSNDRGKAEAVFNLLVLVAKHRKNLITDGLHKEQRDRLQQIAFEMLEGKSLIPRKSIEIKLARSSKRLPFDKEKDLEEWLATHLDILSESIGEEVRLIGRQVTAGPDYACDIVVEGKDYFYPVELKIGQAVHGVVSQIQKYCFYFYRQLRYDRYKPIQGVVIGNGFDSFSINELRKSGIRIFDISFDSQRLISLSEIY